MFTEEDGNRSLMGWQRPRSASPTKLDGTETSKDPTLWAETVQTAVTLARGIGYIAREGYRAFTEKTKRPSTPQARMPANKPGHSSDLVLSVPSREATYAPWKGNIKDRMRRAAGFIGWSLDATRAPQATELRKLHEREKIIDATKQLQATVAQRVDAVIPDDEFAANIRLPLKTPHEMHVAVDVDMVILEVSGPGLAGEYDATYSTLIYRPLDPDHPPSPPAYFRIDDSGNALTELRPATLAEVNLFLKDLS